MSRMQSIKAAIVRAVRFVVPHVRTAGAATVRFGRTCASKARAAVTSDLLWGALRPVFSAARIALVAFFVTSVTLATLRATTRTIPPTEIGVLQHGWGGSAGVVPEDIGPKKVFVLPGRDTLHLVDRGTEFLRFGLESEGNDEPTLTLRTPDDLDVHLGVSVPYRVKPGEAHRLVSEGLSGNYRTLAETTVERVLLEEFSSLSREDWSNSDTRLAAEERARVALESSLAPIHLQPLGVHVTSTWFPPQYEVEIMEQKLMEQRILTDEMLARLDEKQHELKVAKEAIDEAIAVREAEIDLVIDAARLELEEGVRAARNEAQEYSHDRRTESQNQYAKLVAEGQLALEQAEALKQRLTNEAMESEGGRMLLARDAAKSLNVTSVKLDANNPAVPSFLDIDALTKLLIGE